MTHAYALIVDRDGHLMDITYNYETAETMIGELGLRAEVCGWVPDREARQAELDAWYETNADCFGWDD
jgi:hypothetical protein